MKTAVGRRGFLRVLGLAPIAGKAAADKAIAEATGFNPLGSAGLQHYGGPSAPATFDSTQALARRKNLLSFFTKFGSLPQWEIDQIRRETAVYALDPDIAALRSFSMAIKIGMQRERNVARRVETAKGQPVYDELRQDFLKRHGFWFWW